MGFGWNGGGMGLLSSAQVGPVMWDRRGLGTLVWSGMYRGGS